jgi:hypothetical protein
MMQMLERYDKYVAAGILARAALALQSGESEFSSSSSSSVVDNEAALRGALIAEARNTLGIGAEDRSPAVIERIGDYFDSQAEGLIGEPHVEDAFHRLIDRGDFPSDLYEIHIVSNIQNFFGSDFEREKKLIERTVRAPTREQHFGPPSKPNAPYLISLFAREFKTPYPARDFTMLVAGQRDHERRLGVHQAWRLYSARVDVRGATDLVELLRRFADVYGAEIILDGKRDRFFLTSETPIPSRIDFAFGRHKKVGKERREEVTVTQFSQVDPVSRRMHAALVVAIDLNRYRETLRNYDSDEIS